MSRYRLGFYLTILVSVGANGFAANATFSYRAEVPSTGASCDNNAKAIGVLFQKSSGASVTGTSCIGQNTVTESGHSFAKDIVRVDYVADRELAPTRAVLGGQEFLGQIYEHSGLFLSYSACLGQLAAQKQNFERETGLTSVVGYCESDPEYNVPSYSLVVESFGVAKRHLYLLSDQRTSAEPSTLVSLAEAKVIIEAGGSIVFTDPTHIFYYNKTPVSVGASVISYFSSENQCTEQQQMAKSIYVNAGTPSVTVLCVNRGLMVVSRYGYQVQEFTGRMTPLYSTYSDCMSDRARVIQNYTAMGDQPLGALCAQSLSSSNQFLVRVFYKGH